MENTNKNWMYDKEKDLYLARDLLKVDSDVEEAAKKAGVELKSVEGCVMVTSISEIESLLENLESPIPNTKVRIPTFEEYMGFAKTNPEFWKRDLRYTPFEIVKLDSDRYNILFGEEGLSKPELFDTISEDYQRTSDIFWEGIRLLADKL